MDGASRLPVKTARAQGVRLPGHGCAPTVSPLTACQGAIEGDLFELLFHGCAAIRIGAGRPLFFQGDASHSVFGLVAGSVETSIYSVDGQKLTLDMQTGFSIVGEVGALDGGLRAATATCRTDCVVVALGAALLLERIERNPLLAHSMLRLVCSRARWAAELMEDTVFLPIGTRLAKRLLLLDRLMADPPARWIAVSQAEIAESLGATRESVNKVMHGWKRRALVDVRRGFVRICDARNFHHLAVGG